MSLVQMRGHPWLKEAYETSTVGTDINSISANASLVEQVPTGVATNPSAVVSQCPTVLGTTDITNRNNNNLSTTQVSETPATGMGDNREVSKKS